MKKLVLMSLLLLATGHVMAIGTCGNCSVFADNDDRKEKTRKEIGLDYSMPDFETSRIDGKVIGTRLASILQYLKVHENDFTIDIDVINKNKVNVKMPVNKDKLWQKEYDNNELIGTVINDYISENRLNIRHCLIGVC